MSETGQSHHFDRWPAAGLERFPFDLNREDYRGSLGRANQIRVPPTAAAGEHDGEGIFEGPQGAGGFDRGGG